MSSIQQTMSLARLKQIDPGHPGIDLLTGETPLFACQSDQRFSSCLYVPRDIDTTRRHPLVIAVHGTGRDAMNYRDGLADFAEAHQCIVLAPLFPAGIEDRNDVDNYKLIDYHGIRYDLVLLDMVAEAAHRWPITTDRFYLHGFSGGGQFALRFLYLHPDRLAGVSVAAPGRTTLIDPEKPWPEGTADLPDRFSTPLDLDALRAVPVQLLIGEADTQPHPLTGRTRVAGITELRDNLQDNGIETALNTVPDKAHDGMALLPTATRFLHEVLIAGASASHGKSPTESAS
ncbi:alpha/beta hydrolase [Streptomyces sp. NPDC005917]|uniref:alpha/beta hydrolase n=1 Tax=unclassified Streptomyces TaxID=2593676 RepID=UPI0033F383BE